MLWGAAPAVATVTDRSRITTPHECVSWDCAYPMDVSGAACDEVQGRVDARTGMSTCCRAYSSWGSGARSSSP